MRVIEGFKQGVGKQPADDGDAMAFYEASKRWPTNQELDELPNTHGAGASAIAAIIEAVLKSLGLRE